MHWSVSKITHFKCLWTWLPYQGFAFASIFLCFHTVMMFYVVLLSLSGFWACVLSSFDAVVLNSFKQSTWIYYFYCQFCIQWQIWEVFCSLYHTLKFHFCNSSFDLFNLHSYLLSISWRLVQIKHKCLQLNIFLLMERMELSQE